MKEKLKGAFGTGPVAEEIEKEVGALENDDEKAFIMGALETSDKPAEQDTQAKGLLGELIKIIVKVEAAVKSFDEKSDSIAETVTTVCDMARCISDPDVQSCKIVEPFASVKKIIVDTLKDTPKWTTRVLGDGAVKKIRKVAIRAAIFPLVTLLAALKEAAVLSMGPVGRTMDAGLKHFETACDMYDMLTKVKKCVLEKVLELAQYVRKVLEHAQAREFTKLLNYVTSDGSKKSVKAVSMR